MDSLSERFAEQQEISETLAQPLVEDGETSRDPDELERDLQSFLGGSIDAPGRTAAAAPDIFSRVPEREFSFQSRGAGATRSPISSSSTLLTPNSDKRHIQTSTAASASE